MATTEFHELQKLYCRQEVIDIFKSALWFNKFLLALECYSSMIRNDLLQEMLKYMTVLQIRRFALKNGIPERRYFYCKPKSLRRFIYFDLYDLDYIDIYK